MHGTNMCCVHTFSIDTYVIKSYLCRRHIRTFPMTSTSEFSDAIARPDGRTMAVYLSVLVAMFMAALDMNIVVTALPTIAGDMGDVSLFGFMGAAYLLTTA